jgi:Gamma-glutamyl cyclotransferase, AIG2-like
MRCFFFGTLMDSELRRVVLGRALPQAALRRAFLPGFARYRVRGEAFPLLVAEAGGRVDGVLAAGIGANEAARIHWYESDDYDIRETEVHLAADRVTSAFCCLAGAKARHDGVPWDFERWRREDRAFALLLARDWMACFGSADVDRAERNYRLRKRRLLSRCGTEPR